MTIPLLDGLSINGEPAFVRDITVSGTLIVGNGKPQLRLNRKGTFRRIALVVETAPTGADLIVDINLNGTTIFSTQANRPKIVAGATQGNTTTFNTLTFAAGDLLRIDIDQIGSSVAGADLWIGVEYE